jgi:hypothetical protein
MTTEDMLVIIHSYGKPKYRGHNLLNKIMTVGNHVEACGMGTDYDSVVSSLYSNLNWRMYTIVEEVGDGR